MQSMNNFFREVKSWSSLVVRLEVGFKLLSQQESGWDQRGERLG